MIEYPIMGIIGAFIMGLILGALLDDWFKKKKLDIINIARAVVEEMDKYDLPRQVEDAFNILKKSLDELDEAFEDIDVDGSDVVRAMNIVEKALKDLKDIK